MTSLVCKRRAYIDVDELVRPPAVDPAVVRVREAAPQRDGRTWTNISSLKTTWSFDSIRLPLLFTFVRGVVLVLAVAAGDGRVLDAQRLGGGRQHRQCPQRPHYGALELKCENIR